MEVNEQIADCNIDHGLKKEEYKKPYITQFYGSNKKSGQNRGGYAPQFSATTTAKRIPAIDLTELGIFSAMWNEQTVPINHQY